MYFSTTIIADLMEYAAINHVDVAVLEPELPDLNEQKYVDYSVVVKTLNHIGQALNDAYLGLHVGERIALKTTAYVNSIMLNSQTLEESINNAIEYSKLISDALQCSLQKTAQYFSIIYDENPNWGVQQSYAKRQILDVSLLSNVKSLAAYTNYDYYPVQINFVYEKPKNLREHYRLFNCRLKFNQPTSQIIYDRQIMDRHTRQVTFGLLESLKEKVADEIESLPSENQLIYELKKHILQQKPERLLVDDAARKMHLSKRTLQRKLGEFDTTFKAIEHELQLKLAKTYLEEQQKSVDEISYLLGFSESSVFIRFFKSYTQQTPTQYQVKHS